MNEPCKNIRPLLVDYSDGELPAGEAATVAAHLADCPTCRAELRLLEDSLSLAHEVWQVSALHEPTSPLPTNLRSVPGEGPGMRAKRSPKNASRQKILCAGGLALCTTILLAAIGLNLFFNRNSPSTAKKPNSPPQHETAVANTQTQPPATKPDTNEIDALEYIAREGRAARLAASMQMLAAEPNLKEYKDNAERYLRENYADTTAVKMLDQ